MEPLNGFYVWGGILEGIGLVKSWLREVPLNCQILQVLRNQAFLDPCCDRLCIGSDIEFGPDLSKKPELEAPQTAVWGGPWTEDWKTKGSPKVQVQHQEG